MRRRPKVHKVALTSCREISSNLADEANSSYFVSIYRFLDSFLSFLSIEEPRDMHLFLTSPQMLLLATTCLTFYKEKQAVIEGHLGNEKFSIDDLRQWHLDTIIRDFEKSSTDFANDRGAEPGGADSKNFVVLHCLCNYADILACYPSLERGLSSIPHGI